MRFSSRNSDFRSPSYESRFRVRARGISQGNPETTRNQESFHLLSCSNKSNRCYLRAISGAATRDDQSDAGRLGLNGAVSGKLRSDLARRNQLALMIRSQKEALLSAPLRHE